MQNKAWVLVVVSLLGLAGEGRADAPRPPWVPRPVRPPIHLLQPPSTSVVVEVSDHTAGTRLQIPRKLLATLQAAAPGVGRETRWALTGLRFWALALALGAGLGFCGIRILRTRGPAAAAGLGLLLGAVLLAWPEPAAAIQPPPQPPNFGISGQVIVEVVESGDAIKLVLDKTRSWPIRFEP
jgi:hypothetical protein